MVFRKIILLNYSLTGARFMFLDYTLLIIWICPQNVYLGVFCDSSSFETNVWVADNEKIYKGCENCKINFTLLKTFLHLSEKAQGHMYITRFKDPIKKYTSSIGKQ